jgi:hypothetical protein
LLEFTSVYFSESGLSNGLQSIQIKNLGRLSQVVGEGLILLLFPRASESAMVSIRRLGKDIEGFCFWQEIVDSGLGLQSLVVDGAALCDTAHSANLPL